jgi:hypothetical protein
VRADARPTVGGADRQTTWHVDSGKVMHVECGYIRTPPASVDTVELIMTMPTGGLLYAGCHHDRFLLNVARRRDDGCGGRTRSRAVGALRLAAH